MPKNIIFIHLESISNLILWQYRTELKTIWKMMRASYVYNNFYASTTSTRMSLGHIVFGTSTRFDNLGYFRETEIVPPVKSRMPKKHFSIYLADAGYGLDDLVTVMEGFDLKEPKRRGASVKLPNLDQTLQWARVGLTQAKLREKPFFFHFIPSVTHITATDQVKDGATTFSGRFRLGYLRLDYAVSQFLAMLSEFELLDKSVLVFYGDHGDELWSHGSNSGWCHVITPYASLTHTPLFIYDSDRKSGSTDRLVSMIDVKKTVLRWAVPGYVPTGFHESMGRKLPLPSFDDTPYDGIDVNSETRDLVFSQNLFALQKEYDDTTKSLVKGYAVTDGTYRVTVTSGGNAPREGGVEFFCDTVDPSNIRNLLDFFSLDKDGDIIRFAPPPSMAGNEFELVFNPEAVAHLIGVYKKLKHALVEYIKGKEAYAMQYRMSEEIFPMNMTAFRHSRKREYRGK